MKKFLSLVLALVMTMSLVTISAGAKDFTDDSAINYDEAIDVMSALKVVEGYPDGSFVPEKTLTRAEAAKIICNLILGPTTAAALSADAAPFKDVPANHWAAGYIAYCSQQGIINGYGDGVFGVNDTLTGYQYMKMLLCALGYDASIEGYTGSNWSIAVAKRALAIGLDDGNDDFVGTKAVTREEACLYSLNTLTADMVQYGNKTTVNVAGAEIVVGAGEAKKIEYTDNKDYRASVRADVKDDGYQQFCEAYFSKLTLDDQTGIADSFGRPANTWYNKLDKIGTYAKTADLVYTKDVEAQDLYKDLDLNRNYDFTVVVDGIVDGTPFWAIKKDILGGQAADDKIDDAVSSSIGVGNGSLIEVFKDAGKITVTNTFLMQVSGDYDAKNEDLDLSTLSELNYPALNVGALTLSSDDFAGLDAYKDDDYVIVTIASGDIKSIAPAEVVTASVTEYVHESSVTAGGKEYEYAVANNDNAKSYALKEDYNLYLDPYGYVLWADGVDVEDQYVFVYEFSKHSSSAKAAVNAYGYFTDGTEAEIEISKIDGNKINASLVYDIDSVPNNRDTIIDMDGSNGLTAGDYTTGWYKFVKKDTGKYELTALANQTNPGNSYGNHNNVVVDYSSTNHTKIYDGANTKYGNKSTIFVVLKANGDVVTYEGIKNVADINGAADTVVDMYWSGSYAKCVFVDLQSGTITGGANSSDTVFFYKNNDYANDADDDNYYIYKAIVNGKETKVKLDETVANSTLRGLYTDIEYSSKGFIVGKTQVTSVLYPVGNRDTFTLDDGATVNTAVTVDLSKNTLELNGTDYFLAEEYQIFVINGSDVDTYTAKQLDKDAATILPAQSGETWYIAGALNADGEYTTLYIYTV